MTNRQRPSRYGGKTQSQRPADHEACFHYGKSGYIKRFFLRDFNSHSSSREAMVIAMICGSSRAKEMARVTKVTINHINTVNGSWKVCSANNISPLSRTVACSALAASDTLCTHCHKTTNNTCLCLSSSRAKSNMSILRVHFL